MSSRGRENRRMRRYAANPERYNRMFIEAIDKGWRKDKGKLERRWVRGPKGWITVAMTSGLLHKGGKP